MAICKTTNILIAGVGGQGNRTLTNIIAHAALATDEEVHVLSSTSLGRLGGPITCHIRIGPAASATIPMGEVDILVALEMNEALRALPMMRCGALAFIYPYRRVPIIAGINNMHYPSIDEIEKIGITRGITSIFVPESLSLCQHRIAEQGRYSVSANVLMLGVVCGYTRIFARSVVERALCECLPYVVVENLEGFAIGWQYGEKRGGLSI